MQEATAKLIADRVCDLFQVDKDGSETFFEVYDIIRDTLFQEEKELLPVA